MGLTARLLLTLRGGVSAGLGFIPSGRILRARVLVQKDEKDNTHMSMLQALTCMHTWIMKWLEAKPWAHMVITYMY